MSFWDVIDRVVDTVGKIVSGAWDWVTDPAREEQAKMLISVIGIIIGGLGMVRSQPIPNERRPMVVRDILKWLKAVPEDGLAQIIKAKKAGVLDEMLDEEMDEAIGLSIGAYMRSQPGRKERKGKAG